MKILGAILICIVLIVNTHAQVTFNGVTIGQSFDQEQNVGEIGKLSGYIKNFADNKGRCWQIIWTPINPSTKYGPTIEHLWISSTQVNTLLSDISTEYDVMWYNDFDSHSEYDYYYIGGRYEQIDEVYFVLTGQNKLTVNSSGSITTLVEIVLTIIDFDLKEYHDQSLLVEEEKKEKPMTEEAEIILNWLNKIISDSEEAQKKKQLSEKEKEEKPMTEETGAILNWFIKGVSDNAASGFKCDWCDKECASGHQKWIILQGKIEEIGMSSYWDDEKFCSKSCAYKYKHM